MNLHHVMKSFDRDTVVRINRGTGVLTVKGKRRNFPTNEDICLKASGLASQSQRAELIGRFA